MGFLDQPQQQMQAEEQQPQYPNPMFMPQQQFISPDVLKYRLESEDLLDSLEHDLKGEAFIDHKWVPVYPPWANEEGVALLKSIADRYIHRGIYLGQQSPNRIDSYCYHLQLELSKLLFKRYNRYNIDKSKRMILIMKLVDNINYAMSRSENAFESQELGKTTSYQNIVHEQKMPQQPGLFSILNRWKK